MNGMSAAGMPNSSWRPIKSNSASCSGVITDSAGGPCLEGTVRWRGEQGHGVAGLAQGKADWDAWNARSLADEPVVRLILDGTVVDVRLDHKATAIALPVVLGVRMVRRCCSRSRPWAGRAATLARRPRRSDRPAGFAAPTFRIAAPQPDDACQRPPSRCKTPPAAAGIRPYRCTINMYLISMLAARRRHRQNGP
jgi:hypothetical protein